MSRTDHTRRARHAADYPTPKHQPRPTTRRQRTRRQAVRAALREDAPNA